MIGLRETAEADLDFVLAAEADPDAAPWIAEWTRERHRQAIAGGDEEHLIVLADHTPAGYVVIAGIAAPARDIELRRIVVTTRSRGLGRRALRVASERAFDVHGAGRVWLDVLPENERAKRSYRSVGFVFDGHSDDPERLEIMSLACRDAITAAAER